MTARVRVVNTVPLLRAGLERLATSAGLPITDDVFAPIALRTHGQEWVDCSIDIDVDWEEVVVTVRRRPPPGSVRAAARLVGIVLQDPTMRARWVFLESPR